MKKDENIRKRYRDYRGKAVGLLVIFLFSLVLSLPTTTIVQAQGSDPTGSGDGVIKRWDLYYDGIKLAAQVKAVKLASSSATSQWLVTTNTLRQMDGDVAYQKPWMRTEFGQYQSATYPEHLDWDPGFKSTGSGSYTFSITATGPSASYTMNWGHQWDGEYKLEYRKERMSNGWKLAMVAESFSADDTFYNWDRVSHGNTFEGDGISAKGVGVYGSITWWKVNCTWWGGGCWVKEKAPFSWLHWPPNDDDPMFTCEQNVPDPNEPRIPCADGLPVIPADDPTDDL